MSEIDLIIAKAAKEMKYSTCAEACSRTLKDYHADEVMQEGGGPRLRMIAWDRS